MFASSQRISLPLCQICSVFFRLIGGLREGNYNIAVRSRPLGAGPHEQGGLAATSMEALFSAGRCRIGSRRLLNREVILARVGAHLAVECFPRCPAAGRESSPRRPRALRCRGTLASGSQRNSCWLITNAMPAQTASDSSSGATARTLTCADHHALEAGDQVRRRQKQRQLCSHPGSIGSGSVAPERNRNPTTGSG